jgi:nitrate reductase gamma subunit
MLLQSIVLRLLEENGESDHVFLEQITQDSMYCIFLLLIFVVGLCLCVCGLKVHGFGKTTSMFMWAQ